MTYPQATEQRLQTRRTFLAYAASGIGVLAASPLLAADKFIVLASTTSTQDSGLFDYLLPLFTRQSGISVKVLALGTGQALDTARRGDADAVMVHAESAELQFIADGESLKRYPIMYDDFVLIGPRSDPAGVMGMKDIAQVFKIISEKRALFISRGDRSGTHIAELSYWHDAGVDLEEKKGSWYRSIGQGMGASLNAASASNAYVLSDRPSWLHFQNKGDLTLLVEGDPRMFNQYSVMVVNAAKHPTVKTDLAQRFVDYLVSPAGQHDIAGYAIDGRQLFHPNARSDPAGQPLSRQ